jgi:drug/metabolite transporter (DMT)-like permease
MRIAVFGLLYFALFVVFEYINAKWMTSGSWREILRYGVRPGVLVFFALSPILVWGCNHEIYQGIGGRFWCMGAVMGSIELLAYLVGSWLFYREFPDLREWLALLLVFAGLLVAFWK